MVVHSTSEQRFPLLTRAAPPVLGMGIAVFLIALSRRPFRSFDTYFHLRFGDEFRHHWSAAHPGQPSSASTNDWVPTQWLSQVVMSWIHDQIGRTGLKVLFAALICLFASAVYLMLRRHAGPVAAVALTGVIVYGSLPSLSLRPQVLSYLFLIAVLVAWDRTRATGSTPWPLIPLTWIWAMSHGMWIIAIGASLLLALAVIAEQRPSRRRAVCILLVPVGMLAASLLTPAGPRLLSAVVQVNSRAGYFGEWSVPELISLSALPLTATLAAAVLILVRRDAALPYEMAMLTLGGTLAVYSGRTVPLALLVLGAVIARAAGHDAGSSHPASWKERLYVGILVAVVVALAPSQTIVDDPLDDVRPFATDLARLPSGSTVVTERSAGAVLLWTEPRLNIPLHGYGDVYTDAELSRYADLADLSPGWDLTLASLAPQAVLVPDDSPLAYALEHARWTVTRKARGLVLLTPPDRPGAS